jgi:hypothetical protein
MSYKCGDFEHEREYKYFSSIIVDYNNVCTTKINISEKHTIIDSNIYLSIMLLIIN